MPYPSFIFNDETVTNSHGFRILNSGGKFERFNNNPVMLDTHDIRCVIGKWSNLRTENSLLISDPIFDIDDEDGKRVAGKVERGFVKAASMGIYIEAAKYITLPTGEMDLVVTEWELLECSVLGVPSNSGSLAFYSRLGVKLSADEVLSSIKTLAASVNDDPNFSNMNKIILTAEIATALGIQVEHDDMKAINTAIMSLSASKEKAEADLLNFKKDRATTLVELAIQQGKLDATKKDSFIKLATSDYKQASDLLDVLPAKKTLGGNVQENGSSIPGDRAGWDWKKWEKEDPKGLEQLRMREPEEYNRLRFNYKGKYSS